MFLTVLAGILLVYWIAVLFINARGLPLLPNLPLVRHEQQDEPLISIIIAAKEEQDSIAHTIQSILQQSYRQFELIVVNDRSEDKTAAEIERARVWAEEHGYGHIDMRVIHIEQLSEDWLGKNHALYQGYLLARGDYILFTDADVQYQPHTLRSAVHYLRATGVDHVTISPFMMARQMWLRAFEQYFLFSLCIMKPPWLPNQDDQHKTGFGIGAFNLVTRRAYEQIGTHRAIALRPDDDLMLGMKIKQAKLRQRLVLGRDFLTVEWYPNLREAIRGLEKNMFAGLGYSLWMVLAAVIGQLLFFFLPFAGALLFEGWAQYLCILAAVIAVTLYLMYNFRMSNYKGYEAVLVPFTTLLFVYVILRSTYLTLKQGGIYWRGTFYSLRELKKMQES